MVSWRVEVRKKEGKKERKKKRGDKNQELKTKVNRRWKERGESQSKQDVEANIEREREGTCFLFNTSVYLSKIIGSMDINPPTRTTELKGPEHIKIRINDCPYRFYISLKQNKELWFVPLLGWKAILSSANQRCSECKPKKKILI